MPATLRKASAPTVTGRPYARRVASLTTCSDRMAAGAWVAEAQGVERRRRAVVCKLGRLTGTQAPRWSGEISDRDWHTVLAAGAGAVLTRAEVGKVSATSDLVVTAREFTEGSAEPGNGRVIDRTHSGRAEALVDDLLAARADGPASRAEREAIERWSPFRSGPRYVCRSGRYGDGTLAPQH